MKRVLFLGILITILLSGCTQVYYAGQTSIEPHDREPETGIITSKLCDHEYKCPGVLECFNFPDMGSRCAEPNPCKYYDCPPGSRCVLLESYPPKIMCS